MNIHDHIYFGYDGKWVARYEHRTKKSPQKNFGTGTTQYQTIHASGWDAVQALIKYCNDNTIVFSDFDSEAWKKYYDDCDRFIRRMMAVKGIASESNWQMAFSCDAPNKPGYQFANND